MKNRQAYMIIAHHDIPLLKKLVGALDIPEHDIYIHFDKAHYTDEVRTITTSQAKLTVISEIAVHWGSYSMVRCELTLLKLATQTPHSYYHLLSGDDLPLKSAGEIYDFFEHTDKQYVQFCEPELPLRFYDWVYYSHVSREKFRTGKGLLKPMNAWYRFADKTGVLFQKVLGLKKEKKHFPKLQKGFQWFSITEDFAKYILSLEKEIEEDFEYTYIPDETVIPTVLLNSPFLKDQAAPGKYNSPEQIMRFIDWNRGGPYTFTIEDLDLLKNSGCMFARKFSPAKDSEIIDALTGKKTT